MAFQYFYEYGGHNLFYSPNLYFDRSPPLTPWEVEEFARCARYHILAHGFDDETFSYQQLVTWYGDTNAFG